jgi:uncharacterized membrane protein YkoI
LAILAAFTLLGLTGNVVFAKEKKFEDFDHKNFDHPTKIDNEWLPLKPGMRYVYKGTTIDDENEAVPHRVEINVTDLTKVIDGVRSVVTWDLDFSDGDLVEAELAFFAQDNDGNVWRMGEYPEEYDDGKFEEAPAWIAGIEDAKAGISMRAKPQTGTPSYSQGWGPGVGFTDRGMVYQTGQKTCVPFDCYEDVLVIAESSEEEGPDAQQLKYFARGVGNIRVGWKGAGEKTKETLELVEIVQLGPEDLAKVRAKALELEKHAYEVSKNVYAKTPALESASGTALKTDKPATKAPPVAKTKASKITEEEAVKIALKEVPGDVTAVAIEKKLGANRYVVEVLAKEGGVETDVIIDMQTGKVLATEK